MYYFENRRTAATRPNAAYVVDHFAEWGGVTEADRLQATPLLVVGRATVQGACSFSRTSSYSSYSSSVQNAMTRSTTERLYQDRSKRVISPAADDASPSPAL